MVAELILRKIASCSNGPIPELSKSRGHEVPWIQRILDFLLRVGAKEPILAYLLLLRGWLAKILGRLTEEVQPGRSCLLLGLLLLWNTLAQRLTLHHHSLLTLVGLLIWR